MYRFAFEDRGDDRVEQVGGGNRRMGNRVEGEGRKTEG